MRFTNEQYDKAIAHLQEARMQLEPDGHGCHCCGDNRYMGEQTGPARVVVP